MTEDRKRRPSRRLSADEHALWKTVTRAIKPLATGRPVEGIPDQAGRAGNPQQTPSHGKSTAPFASRKSAQQPLAPLERRLRQRLAKGNERIDRRLDLHGLTQREAHDALAHFLRSAQSEGARIVLVVTGKGARGAERDPFSERGVLRRLVPQWLKGSEFRNLVVGFEAAHVGHGGTGALYVQLRRRRS